MNKQNVLNLLLKLDGSWKAKNTPKRSSNLLDRQNMENETIFELYKLMI